MFQDKCLEIKNIDVFYGPYQALWEVSMMVGHGEMVALIGANASGKSTLINTISGILHPSKGYIKFNNIDITNLEPFQIVSLGISQVPEGRRVFPELTVLDNLILGSYNKRARSKLKQNLLEVFNLFPVLGQRKNQLAKTLSGGEQQMLAIGRALMSEPLLVLFDEISLGLAPKVVQSLYKVLRKIKNKGISIVLVEQSAKRALQEADRAYIMKTGRIILETDAARIQNEEEIKKAYFGL